MDLFIHSLDMENALLHDGWIKRGQIIILYTSNSVLYNVQQTTFIILSLSLFIQ